MSDRATRLVGLYATIAAAAAIVLAPLLALSYFATEEGASELETGTVSAWADPARDLAGGLLTFASADRVYATYTQLLALLLPAIVLCAWAARERRGRPETRVERWGWRVTLAGYALIALGVGAVSVVLVVASPSSPVTNLVFLPLIVPGILLGTVGSTVLGIRLLRSAYRPRLTSWLLALAFLLWIAASVVLGHNSLGLVPLFLAWAATGWQLRSLATRTGVPAAAY